MAELELQSPGFEPRGTNAPPSGFYGAPRTRLERGWAALKRGWPIWLVSGATLANGLLGFASMLWVRYQERPEFFAAPLPFGLYHWGRSLTLFFSFVLGYLSFHLFQRRRTAWALAVVGSTLAGVVHIGHTHVWYTALVPIATLVVLFLFHNRFTVHSEPSNITQGLMFMGLSVLIALAYGTVGFWMLDKRDFGLQFTLVDALVRTLREFTLVGNPDLVAQTRHARWFLESLRLLGVASGLFAVYSLFRPVAYRLRTLPHQRAVMKGLLEQYGGTSLDYFKFWHDKSFFLSHDNRCGIAYRTVGGVALALGDPAGAPEALEETTRGYLRFCTDNGWAVAFHQAQPNFLPLYRHLGLRAIKIGEEAVVNLDRFATDTLKHSKHMRHTRNKFEKEGHRFDRRLAPHDAALLDELEQVSKEWLQVPGRHERSFSLGFFDRSYLNECTLDLLYDPLGHIVAFSNEVPSYRPGEATIDLMRHRLNAPNGSMDYLFTALMLRLHEEGYRTFNLGMAPYAGVGNDPQDPLEERAAHQLVEHLTRFVDYKGMRDYKGKFEPDWEDRFFIYQGSPLGLVRAAVALVQATDRFVRS
jgi:phosphatidylglycerol lysyltransferase